jgi:hypothetical protein
MAKNENKILWKVYAIRRRSMGNVEKSMRQDNAMKRECVISLGHIALIRTYYTPEKQKKKLMYRLEFP